MLAFVAAVLNIVTYNPCSLKALWMNDDGDPSFEHTGSKRQQMKINYTHFCVVPIGRGFPSCSFFPFNLNNSCEVEEDIYTYRLCLYIWCWFDKRHRLSLKKPLESHLSNFSWCPDSIPLGFPGVMEVFHGLALCGWPLALSFWLLSVVTQKMQEEFLRNGVQNW